MEVTNLDIETFKFQLLLESMELLNDENPATYAIILKHFDGLLNERQIEILNKDMIKAKAKINYLNRMNVYESDLKPYVHEETQNNYVVRHE